LKKIGNIKHYDRTTDRISKMLSKDEKEVLNSLLAKKVLFIYYKNKKELLGISKEYFKYFVPDDASDFTYAIFDNEREAAEIIKKQKYVRGVRGFDKKFYLISEAQLRDIEKKLQKILVKDKGIEAISTELKIEENLCRAALENLREEGTVIEKKKNVYAWA
jgi:hypothetical protein